MNRFKVKKLLLLVFFASGISSVFAQQLTPAELIRNIDTQMRLGNSTQAMVLANQVIAIDPKDAQGYFARGRILAIKGEHEKAITDFTKVAELNPKASQAFQERGGEHFKLGQIDKAIADFDKVVEVQPKLAPYLWQRAIAYCEAGRWEEAQKQFELHQTVNSNDVENAAWHFLCVAKNSNFEKARQLLLPIKEDKRVPMMEIYTLLQGKRTEEAVLKAAEQIPPKRPGRVERQMFYAHLYLGLYLEAKGEVRRAHDYLEKAAAKASGNDYMGDVARVHLEFLKKRAAPAAPKK